MTRKAENAYLCAMDCFNVTILGCGSAKPTLRHSPTSQVVNFRGNMFLVDCGEGVQVGMARSRISVGRIGHIFLSHLHGDHCLGLVGFIASLGLGQRTGEIVIHAHPDAERIFQPLFDFFCPKLSMEVRFESHDPLVSSVIYEDRNLLVKTIPLCHRVPTAGFLFQEKERERHLKVEKCEQYGIPIAYYKAIKKGMDWTDADGNVIPNIELTTDPTPSKSYAFVGDTIQTRSIIPIIQGCDLLYHESTYAHVDVKKARERGHSTARQAAEIAKEAGVKKLILGHYSSQFLSEKDEEVLLQEAREIFPESYLTNEKMRYDV